MDEAKLQAAREVRDAVQKFVDSGGTLEQFLELVKQTSVELRPGIAPRSPNAVVLEPVNFYR